ncbi:MAG: hypothetical protein LC664_07080 [Flavobacteriales bacterium]|nr:hypothetical protein [Flavobacteriales bacterium]
MKTPSYLIALFLLMVTTTLGYTQGVYFDPSPTDVTAPARLYVDITSGDCVACEALQDADPETNPLYLWAWNPNESRPPVNGDEVTNGEWTSSNENLKMTQDPDNPNLWYFDFLDVSLVEFYNTPASVFYADGIDFLVKEKSGASPAEGEPEQKSGDMNIVPEPLGCFDKVCPFPTTFFQDEYFFITYNNAIENISSLQNLGPDECLIWFRYRVNGGSPILLQEESEKFTMSYDGEGQFSLSMIPEDYFELAEGDILTSMEVYITKSPIQAPPFTSPIALTPGCE